MISRLTFSQRGHTILLGDIGLGLLNGLLVTGKMCEYAEDSIVDNFISETMKKERKDTSSVAIRAINSIESGEYFPDLDNFVTYATSEAFLDLMR